MANLNNSNFFNKNKDIIKNTILNNVHKLGGSFSAEHGIGQLKKNELLNYKDKNIIELMKQIKKSFDPSNILNPGKILN